MKPNPLGACGLIVTFAVLLPVAIAQEAKPFEQMLVPFDTSTTRGARGAEWSAELRVRNSADVAVNLFPETCSWIGRTFPCDRKIVIPPGQTSLLKVLPGASTDVASAVLLYVPVAHTADIHFTLTVRDIRSDPIGTTVPVVPTSRFATRYTIVGIPISAVERRTLRVYDPFMQPDPYRVRVIDDATNVMVLEREYTPTFATDSPAPPLVPLTSDFSDSLMAPEVLRAQRVTVFIERRVPVDHGFWAMVSVTSNIDNHFAVFVPY